MKALLSLGVLALAAPALAQTFTPGDLVLYSPAIQGSSSSDGAIVRIDPFSGATSQLLDLTKTPQSFDGCAYDPFRDRLIFCAGLGTVNDPVELYLMDGAGGTTSLGFAGTVFTAFAPASGGRIYLRNQGAPVLRYLDASNGMHPLLDASGAQPFVPPHHDVRAMTYDAGTNALFVAVATNNPWHCGAPSIDVSVTRLELSADGTRVTDASDCVTVAVDSSGCTPVGLSRGPGGSLLITIDNNSNGTLPRVQRIDPVTLAVTPFASNGNYVGAAATNAGTWSTLRGQAVILDTFANVLRAFDAGESGEGTVITPSSQISSAGGSGEIATLLEIPPGGCSSGVATYCQAKTTSGGCLPTIVTSGSPSASAGSGFVITATDVQPDEFGLFFYGLSGAAAIPLQGGLLCVEPPFVRTSVQFSGGAGPCSGTFAFDFNAHIASGVDPLLQPGAVVHGQFWFRDPAHPIAGTGLTGGVTFTICP